MELNTITGTDLKVSAAGLGCNNFGKACDERQSRETIHAAMDAGINFFDTADIYGGRGRSEEILGRVLSGIDRDSIIIATKFGNRMSDDGSLQGASCEYIRSAVEASLKRLNIEYIDLYQQHVPDPETPIEESLRALDDLVSQGKVRFIGNSNFSGWQIADADWSARNNKLCRFVTAQNEYSLLERGIERELVPACQRFDLDILPYFPLARGLLTGKYQRDASPPAGTRLASHNEKRLKRIMSEEAFDRIDALTTFAGDTGHSLLELAMSWLISQPNVPSVIAGATSVDQVRQNAAAVAWKLTPGELEAVDAL